MPPTSDTPASDVVRQAEAAAASSASSARVSVSDESAIDTLRDVADLFVTVWGTSPQGAPIPADLLRSIWHAGCPVTVARDAQGGVVGAAAAIVSPGTPSMYSLIAGVRPGTADRGVGFALKQHQRAWGLTRGYTEMTWTFDPLVSRNARFNLTKLGAHASSYERDFYGRMDDGINSDDESDRLVAVWALDSTETIACSERRSRPVDTPVIDPDAVLAWGPDGLPVLVDSDGALWCRVPVDIVQLRASDPGMAAAWRRDIRSHFIDAFSTDGAVPGLVATGVSRDGWYRLSDANAQVSAPLAHPGATE